MPAMQCGIDNLPDTADTLLNFVLKPLISLTDSLLSLCNIYVGLQTLKTNYEEKNNNDDLEFAYTRTIFMGNPGRSITTVTAVDAFNLGIHMMSKIPVGLLVNSNHIVSASGKIFTLYVCLVLTLVANDCHFA